MSTAPSVIPDIFYSRVQRTADETAVLFKKGGQWRSTSWRELEAKVLAVANAIAAWVEPKDMVCLLSENRPEWWIADLVVLSLGAVTAPIYATNPPKDVAYIINDCGAKVLFVSTKDQLEKIRSLREEDQLPNLEHVVVFDDVDSADDIVTLAELVKKGAEADDVVTERRANIKPEDLATLIYTSGTTGEPKGVMLTHSNIVTNVLGGAPVLEELEVEEKLMLSFLPLSHSFERTMGYYVAIHTGFKVAFAESIQKLVDNMGEVHPTMLISVPRIYEKFYAAVMQIFRAGFKKKLLKWALAVGRKQVPYRLEERTPPLLQRMQYALATKMVFSKLHARMGGRLWHAISGGAPLAPDIANFLFAIGLTVYEGYGLSETSPIVTANIPGSLRIGSVGKAWPDVEIEIEPDAEIEAVGGEIIVKGPNVMQGYYNKPEATEQVLSDGWFRTGDIGYLDPDGFLFITDRKKELLKTSGGKYVAPQPLENNLKAHPLVEQVVVVGNNRKYCVALIVPSFDALSETIGRPLPDDRSKLNNDAEVCALFQAAVDDVNRGQGSWEQIKRFHLLPKELTQDANEITPTLKVKRRVVDERYKDEIASLYP